MNAFLTGSDDNFDQLLEVSPTPAHLHMNCCKGISINLSPKVCNARRILARCQTTSRASSALFLRTAIAYNLIGSD